MRLLLCTSCRNIIHLKSVHKECECGNSGGRFISKYGVNHYGNSKLLAIMDVSLAEALGKQETFKDVSTLYPESSIFKGDCMGYPVTMFLQPMNSSSSFYFPSKEQYLSSLEGV